MLGMAPGAQLGSLRRSNTLGIGGPGSMGKPSIDVALERGRALLLRDRNGAQLPDVWSAEPSQIGQVAGPGAGLYFVVMRLMGAAMGLVGFAVCVMSIPASDDAVQDPCEMCAYQLYGKGEAAVEACRVQCEPDPGQVWVKGEGVYLDWIFRVSSLSGGAEWTWVWMVFDTAVLALFFVFMLFVRRNVMDSLEAMDATTVSAGDYAVVVQPDVFNADLVPALPGGLARTHRTRTEALADFFRHYGAVVRCFVPYDYGEVLVAEKARLEAKLELDELHAQLQTLSMKAAAGENVDRATARVNAKVQAFAGEVAAQKQVIEREVQVEFLNAGYAFVVFDTEEARGACLRDLHRGFRRRWADWLCCSPPPPEFEDPADGVRYRLQVDPAPEPEDVAWENLHIQGPFFWYRQFFVNLLVVFLIVVGGALQAALQSAKDTLNEEARRGVGAGSSSVGVTGLTALAAILVSMINSMILACFKNVSNWERHHTRTELTNALVWRMAAAQLVNSALLPVLSSMWRIWVTQESGYALDSWFMRGGLLEQLLFIQVMNSVSQDVLTALNLEHYVARNVTAPKAATQRKLDAVLQPTQFDLAASYANGVKTLALALLLGPILPMSYPIAAIGIASSYLTDKYVLLRLRKAPYFVTSHSTAAAALKVTRVVLVLRVLINRYWWFSAAREYTVGAGRGDTLFVVNLIICFIFWVLPVKAILNAFGCNMLESSTSDQGTNGLRCSQAQALAVASGGRVRPLRVYRPAIAQGTLPDYVWDSFASPPQPWPATGAPMPGQMAGTHPSERPEDARADVDALIAQYASESKIEREHIHHGEYPRKEVAHQPEEVKVEKPLPPGWIRMPASTGVVGGAFRRDENMLEATANAHRRAAEASIGASPPQYNIKDNTARTVDNESSGGATEAPRPPQQGPSISLRRQATRTLPGNIEWMEPHFVQCPQCDTVVESVSRLWHCPVCFQVNEG